jgi:catechol 2,3-dioxygenase-like lactoylglutathione lyase family enzyme
MPSFSLFEMPMSNAPVIEDAMPIVPVADIAATMAFYTEVLGFEPRFVASDRRFAMLAHGAAAIQFIKTDDPGALAATATNIAIYLPVRGVDRLYEALRPQLVKLPEGRVRPPFDQAYGMREFHVKDPDGCLLFFGEDL